MNTSANLTAFSHRPGRQGAATDLQQLTGAFNLVAGIHPLTTARSAA